MTSPDTTPGETLRIPRPRTSPGPADSGAPEVPGVSVVIATRDRDVTLRRALEAVWAQTFAGPMQVVVVYDGTPPGRDLPVPPRPDVQRLEVRTNQRTPGVAGARNTGLATVRFPYVATCDDDDVWLPGRLEAQLPLLTVTSEPPVAVGGSIRIRRAERSIVRRAPVREVVLRDLLEDRIMELHPSAMLYRTDALRAIGGWDETMPGGYAEDYDLLLRLARTGSLALVEEVTADIHWDGGSYFFSRWRTVAEALTVLLERNPEFAETPRGRARIEGQIAFALAAVGDRVGARRWLAAGRRDHAREPRLALTRLVLTGLVSAETVQRVLHARGRGI